MKKYVNHENGVTCNGNKNDPSEIILTHCVYSVLY